MQASAQHAVRSPSGWPDGCAPNTRPKRRLKEEFLFIFSNIGRRGGDGWYWNPALHHFSLALRTHLWDTDQD